MLVLFLSTCGIEPEYAIRLHHICGEDALEQLQENPYLLTGDGIGAPFGTADRLVRTDERYRSVAENLLGRIVVADTFDPAATATEPIDVCLDPIHFFHR